MSGTSSPRVLVVTGRRSQQPMGEALRQAGYSVVWAQTYGAATRSLHHAKPHVIVLVDQALDLRAAGRLVERADECGIPLLVMRVGERTQAGREAFLPDAPQVADLGSLLDQLEAVVAERTGPDGGVERLVLGDITVDLARHLVLAGDRPLDLTQKEFELLVELMRHPGWVFTRRQLLEAVWGDGFVDPRVVTVHIGNVRRKLGDEAEIARHIETVRNVGYRFVEAGALEGRSRPPSSRDPAIEHAFRA